MRADKRIQDTPVIVISAQQELDNVVKCIEMGAEDYLPKPFNPVLLRARINATLDKKRLRDQEKFHQRLIEEYNKELQEQVQEQVREIASSQLGAIFAMSKLAESKDPETGAHLERMREYCKLVSCQLQKSNGYENVITDEFVNNIYAASPLHDIGKVGVPDNVLLKPGKLTTDEWVAMKEHTTIGADTLRAVNEHHPGNAFLQMGIEIAECHHEKWDGSGYPKGLSNTGIPLAARILALGDVYDALTSKRCYKDAFSHEKSRGIILEGKGSHFDPDVVDAFLENEDEFIKIRSYYEDED
jgi:putative two-component system response regulator